MSQHDCGDCGATLVHDIGPGFSATLCPVCDRERIEEFYEPDYAAVIPGMTIRLDAETIEQLERQANAANRAMRHCVVPHSPITAVEIAKAVLETWAFRKANGYPN